MTLNVIFPVAGDQASRSILISEVAVNGLDSSFLEPPSLQYAEHEQPQDAVDPSEVRTLYERYQYWGDRLYDLWKEADDPTPVTKIERWSESRRNPRFTYWCTVISLTVPSHHVWSSRNSFERGASLDIILHLVGRSDTARVLEGRQQ